VSEEHQAY